MFFKNVLPVFTCVCLLTVYLVCWWLYLSILGEGRIKETLWQEGACLPLILFSSDEFSNLGFFYAGVKMVYPKSSQSCHLYQITIFEQLHISCEFLLIWQRSSWIFFLDEERSVVYVKLFENYYILLYGSIFNLATVLTFAIYMLLGKAVSDIFAVQSWRILSACLSLLLSSVRWQHLLVLYYNAFILQFVVPVLIICLLSADLLPQFHD